MPVRTREKYWRTAGLLWNQSPSMVLRYRLIFLLGGVKHSMSNRKEKKEENREGTQTSKHPNGYPKLEVFEKAATKKDDHNHPNSLQRVNYRKENINTSGNMVNICMIRALF